MCSHRVCNGFRSSGHRSDSGVGHDGGSIIFPDLPEPENRHGHNIYELIWAAVNLGYAVTPIPLQPGIKPASDSHASLPSELIPGTGSGFRNHIHGSVGVIECMARKAIT